MANADIYSVHRDKKGEATACVELVESHDDGGWYAHEFDFTREDNKTRTSANIYLTRDELLAALNSGEHTWSKWD